MSERTTRRSKGQELALILTVAPVAAAVITLESRSARWWPLRFPRSIAELEDAPERLVDLLTRPSRGLVAALELPPGARFVSLRRTGQLTHEPDKNRTTAPLTLRFTFPAVAPDAGPEQTGEHVVRVVAKFQSGRGLPLYMQAIRVALESGFAREIAFYRHLAPIVPVRVPAPRFADAVTAVNRVCLVMDHVDGTTLADWRGCPMPAMQALLSEAAKLNGGFLNRLREPAVAWIPASDGLDFMSFVTGFIGKTEPWYRNTWAALQRYFSGKPVTLVHGDCRPGNMFFTGEAPVAPDASLREDESAAWPEAAPLPGVVMADWEAVNVAPLLWDFTYATVIGLRTGDRRAWLDRLLDEFLAALQRAGVDQPHLDRNRCRLEVDLLAMVLAYLSLVIIDHKLWSGQGNTAEDGRAWITRVVTAATASDADVVGRALGVEPSDVRRLQEHWRGRLGDVLASLSSADRERTSQTREA